MSCANNPAGSINKIFVYAISFLLLAVLTACQGYPPQQASEAAQDTAQESETAQNTLQESEGLTASFDYKMAERFGLDSQGNDIPDLPNSVEYVQNNDPFRAPSSENCYTVDNGKPTFTVYFNATESDVLSSLDIDHYYWKISGEDISEFELEGPEPCANLPEQAYNVSLIVASGEFGARIEKTVLVEDILFVSMGDSYSSGEGNPERRLKWADPGIDNELEGFQHIRSHRSTLAWPAQAALAIELADPHTSVTFISVAETGAMIKRGLIGEFQSASKLEGLEGLGKMPPQVLQVRDLVLDRRIDVMTISVGINDIGFSNLATALMIKGAYISGTPLPEITEATLNPTLDNGDWDGLIANGVLIPQISEMLERNIPWRDRPGFNNLPLDYEELKAFMFDPVRGALEDNVDNDDIYVMEYPDPTSFLNEEGGIQYCWEIMAHFNWFFEAIGARIDGSELEWVDENVLRRLNNVVREAAVKNDWNYVPGVAAIFSNGGHGYCATPPYPSKKYPGNPFSGGPQILPYPNTPGISWFRTAHASSIIEGPVEHTKTIGTLHPNELGHRAVSEVLLANLELPVSIPGIGDGMDPQVAEVKEPSGFPDGDHQFMPGLTNLREAGVCFSGGCVSAAIGGAGAFDPFFPPLAASFESNAGIAGVSTEVNPLGARTTFKVGLAEIYVDAKTGVLLAINTGNGWVDAAGDALLGNPLDAVKELYGLFRDDEEPLKRTIWYTSENPPCFYTNWLTAKSHQAELDGNAAWLEANGFEQTFHHYSMEKCYPLKEWEPSQRDTDQDGLIDYSEMHTFLTDPNDADTDDDGLSDGYEFFTSRTYFNLSDTDGDGVSDKIEDEWWQSLTESEQDQAFARDPDWPSWYYPTCLDDYYKGRPYVRHPGLCAHIVP
jgi:hypothetical protein